MAAVRTRLTRPLPSPRPLTLAGLPTQSANEAPSGRVITYANQNDPIGFQPSHRYPIAGTVISRANSTMERPYPRRKVYAVRSSHAVPYPNLPTTHLHTK